MIACAQVSTPRAPSVIYTSVLEEVSGCGPGADGCSYKRIHVHTTPARLI